jgi:hypothetical protein
MFPLFGLASNPEAEIIIQKLLLHSRAGVFQPKHAGDAIPDDLKEKLSKDQMAYVMRIGGGFVVLADGTLLMNRYESHTPCCYAAHVRVVLTCYFAHRNHTRPLHSGFTPTPTCSHPFAFPLPSDTSPPRSGFPHLIRIPTLRLNPTLLNALNNVTHSNSNISERVLADGRQIHADGTIYDATGNLIGNSRDEVVLADG